MRGSDRQSTLATRGGGADGPRLLAVLALLALCWAQVALAAHQFEHPAGAADDACRVCAQLDRVDDGIVAAANGEAPLSSPFRARAAVPSLAAAGPAIAPRQRAPPLS